MQRRSLSAAGRGSSRPGLLGCGAGQPRQSAQTHTQVVRRQSGDRQAPSTGLFAEGSQTYWQCLWTHCGRGLGACSPGSGAHRRRAWVGHWSSFAGCGTCPEVPWGRTKVRTWAAAGLGHVCVCGRRERETYPIQSSGGGRVGGLTHSGDSRRCRRNSAEYRSGMVENRGGNDHQLQGCDVACMR